MLAAMAMRRFICSPVSVRPGTAPRRRRALAAIATSREDEPETIIGSHAPTIITPHYNFARLDERMRDLTLPRNRAARTEPIRPRSPDAVGMH